MATENKVDHQETELQDCWSRIAGDHLSQILNQKGISVVAMAARLGVSRARLTKILSGTSSDLNLAASCMVALTGQADGLFGIAPQPILAHTGVARIDQMVVDIYSDQSKSGLNGLKKYVTDDYRCCNHEYTKREDPLNEVHSVLNDHLEECTTIQQHGVVVSGIPFELEEKLTLKTAENESIFFQAMRVINADIISPTSVIVEHTRTKQIHDECHDRSTTRLYDQLIFTNTIEQIQAGHALRISRKIWRRHKLPFEPMTVKKM